MDTEEDKTNLKQERIVLHGIEVLLILKNTIQEVVLTETSAEIQIQIQLTQFGASFKEVLQSIFGNIVCLFHRHNHQVELPHQLELLEWGKLLWKIPWCHPFTTIAIKVLMQSMEVVDLHILKKASTNGGKQVLVKITTLLWLKSETELIAVVKDLQEQKLWLEHNFVQIFQAKLQMDSGSLSLALDLLEETLFNYSLLKTHTCQLLVSKCMQQVEDQQLLDLQMAEKECHQVSWIPKCSLCQQHTVLLTIQRHS